MIILCNTATTSYLYSSLFSQIPVCPRRENCINDHV
jgi:hypothetical protein